MTQASFLLAMSCIALLSAGVSGAPPSPRRRRDDCPDRCGNIPIPYPFGIGPDCSLMPGFRVRCNASGLFTGGIRIGSITLETAQMVVLRPLTYSCNMTGAIPRNMSLRLKNTAFLVSPEDNVFTAVGCGTAARLRGNTGGARYLTGCMSACVLNRTGEDGAPCRGLGCCEASLATGLNRISVRWFESIRKNTCQYAFVAEKGWYNFSRAHLNKNTFAKKYGNGEVIPIVLDWAIGRKGKNACTLQLPYGVCISNNSHCVNPSNGAAGYFCRCNKGYTGNPYQKGGCTDINECNLKMSEDLYPCHGGTCLSVEGGYECKCNFGRRGNGKSNKGCEHVLSPAAAAMIGTTIVISVSAVLLVFIHMEHEKRRLRDRFNKNGGRLLNNIKIEVFRKEDLDKITKSYSTIIGRGAFGEVYKGTTSEYVPVAVKRSVAINEDRQKDFANEIQIQSQISHKYIVRLLGCCLETEVPMLVYEFVPMGSLHDVLHGKNGNVRRNPISLRARLSIAVCSADALAYMHSQANQKILHGDVKSGNILLDNEFVPKVSDFGTSRLMSIEKDHTNLVIGDSSYIDPVYMKTGLLTEKSDVYSFGIVLLELITRKKPRYGENNSLPLNYVRASMEGATGQMYDTEILSSGQDAKCLGEIGLIAVQCLEVDVDDRPTMTEVAEKIKRCKSRWLQSHWHGKTKAL